MHAPPIPSLSTSATSAHRASASWPPSPQAAAVVLDAEADSTGHGRLSVVTAAKSPKPDARLTLDQAKLGAPDPGRTRSSRRARPGPRTGFRAGIEGPRDEHPSRGPGGVIPLVLVAPSKVSYA